MLIQSLLEENSKPRKIRVVLDTIVLGEEHTILSHDVLIEKTERVRKKHHVNKADVGYSVFSRADTFNGGSELVMEIWHMKMETDAEYKARLQKIEVRDLQEFYKLIASYNYVVGQRKVIADMFERLGKTKSTPPYWMKDMLKKFFAYDLDQILSEIEGIYGDAVKYPQLALPEHQLERLKKLL